MTSARNHLGPKPKLWQKRTREAPLCRSSGADFRKVLASEEELYVNLTRWSLVWVSPGFAIIRQVALPARGSEQ